MLTLSKNGIRRIKEKCILNSSKGVFLRKYGCCPSWLVIGSGRGEGRFQAPSTRVGAFGIYCGIPVSSLELAYALLIR